MDKLVVVMIGLSTLWLVQFTDLQQKEQLAKLAMARNDLASAPSTKKFKFVSAVNDQVSLMAPLLVHRNLSANDMQEVLPFKWRTEGQLMRQYCSLLFVLFPHKCKC